MDRTGAPSKSTDASSSSTSLSGESNAALSLYDALQYPALSMFLSPMDLMYDIPPLDLPHPLPSSPEEHRQFLLSILTAAEALVDESLLQLLGEEDERRRRCRPPFAAQPSPSTGSSSSSSPQSQPKQ